MSSTPQRTRRSTTVEQPDWVMTMVKRPQWLKRAQWIKRAQWTHSSEYRPKKELPIPHSLYSKRRFPSNRDGIRQYLTDIFGGAGQKRVHSAYVRRNGESMDPMFGAFFKRCSKFHKKICNKLLSFLFAFLIR